MCGAFLLAVAISGIAQAPSGLLTVEIRVFLGGDEVTGATRVTLHRAGDRSTALAPAAAADGRHVFAVAAGIYDAQAVREQDGRVLNIRWAERLVIMPYPDEGGRHLEVVNFTSGYGALQVKAPRSGEVPEVAIFTVGERTRPAAPPIPNRHNEEYVLFVVPAARYDLQVKSGARPTWHADLEIPLDRTRLWVIPEGSPTVR
jgi:hypothetical protein